MKKLVSILLTLAMAMTACVAVASAETDEQLLVIDGEPAKIVYVSNECASDWQAIGTSYLKALVEAEGGTCQIYNPENDAATQAQMLLREAVRWTESGVLAAASGHLRIPPARMLVSDAVIESFFETEQDGAECATK